MMEFRISRDGEYKVLRPGRCRLYEGEGGDLVHHLNAVPHSAAAGLLADLGPNSYQGRRRVGSSMVEAAQSLMKVLASGLRAANDDLWFAAVVAECLNVHEDPWLRETTQQFVISDMNAGKRRWPEYVFSVILHSLSRSSEITPASTTPRSCADSTHVRPITAVLARDDELLQRVIGLYFEIQKRGAPGFFEEYRRRVHSYTTSGVFTDEWCQRELRALELLETHLVEIGGEFELTNKIADISIRAAIQVFDRWVHQRLNTAGLSCRLVLDRLTSTYRLVPPEACRRLDDPNHLELRYIQPRTVLSACLIAYLTLPGIDGRVEEWVEGVGLIDRLGFADVLGHLLRCPVCGRWVYAVYTRRDYCGDKCRYRVWMKTPKGLEKRRRASSAWRSRFSEEIRRATPNVRRRGRTR